jgi:hypothetical protein
MPRVGFYKAKSILFRWILIVMYHDQQQQQPAASQAAAAGRNVYPTATATETGTGGCGCCVLAVRMEAYTT